MEFSPSAGHPISSQTSQSFTGAEIWTKTHLGLGKRKILMKLAVYLKKKEYQFRVPYMSVKSYGLATLENSSWMERAISCSCLNMFYQYYVTLLKIVFPTGWSVCTLEQSGVTAVKHFTTWFIDGEKKFYCLTFLAHQTASILASASKHFQRTKFITLLSLI